MNVLIVGLGSIAHKHVDALRKIDSSVSIYALRSSTSSKHWEEITDLYAWEEVLEVRFDFVIVSNPTSEHKDSINKLLDLDIPLFIEKPLFHRLDIEEQVMALFKSNKLTYVACNLRFLDALLFVKQRMADLKLRINEVNVYCGSYLPDWRKGVDYKKNYSAIPELGGGVHIDLIHEVDYVYWLFGIPYKINRIFKKNSSLEICSYDYANYCMEYSNFCAGIVLNYYRRDAKRTLEIVCEEVTISVDLLQNTVWENGKIVFQSRQEIKDTYFEQMKYFIHCLSDNKQSFNTILDAYRVLQICLES